MSYAVNPKQDRLLNIMLIGCGYHAKHTYLPALANLKNQYSINLRVVVDLEGKSAETKGATNAVFNNVEFLFAPLFKSGKFKLSGNFKKQLDNAVNKQKIDGVIIATEPLSHIEYALWAIDRDLHILLDKPISTHKNISNSVTQADKLVTDYKRLILNRDPTKAFIVNAQRRYHPGFQYVLSQINDVATEYGIPITTMQSTHSDGQWRLPKEILTQEYHPYFGYGKVSHSGYHLIDLIGCFTQDSFSNSGKTFNSVSAYSSFVRPSGLLSQQNRDDYMRIFGEEYEKENELNDRELAVLYKEIGEAEVDSSSLITLFNGSNPIANITLNLAHNGFARRSWLNPGRDLYKGNGRVKHEYHNIEQGPYQNIQIHSYQANDKHEINSKNDYILGGNNHFDIYVFRNSGILGGKPLEIISSKDLASQLNYDGSRLITQEIKQRIVKEFLEIMLGKRKPAETHSDLSTHAFSVDLMALIYRSGIKRREVVINYVKK